MWPWRVKMPTRNALRWILLLMLMIRIVLATVCCRFGSWGLFIKLNFCSDCEHNIWSRFWNWSSGELLKLKFTQYFAADVWFKLWSWILVNILKLGLVKILTLDLVEMLMFGWDFEVDAWSKLWRWNFIRICGRISILEMKTFSNLKLQENKLALKFNLTKENMCPQAFWPK